MMKSNISRAESTRMIKAVTRMIHHLYLFHMMYFQVFKGEVMQRNEVAGRCGGSNRGFSFGSSLRVGEREEFRNNAPESRALTDEETNGGAGRERKG